MTRLILVIISLLPYWAYAQESPRITEVVFYGFEDPRLNSSASFVSNNSYNKKGAEHVQNYYFSLEGQITIDEKIFTHEKAKFHLLVKYEKAPEILFIVHDLDSVYVVETDRKYFLIDEENVKYWEVFLGSFIEEMFDTHNILFNDKQVVAFVADSAKYLLFYEENASQFKFPVEYQSWSKEAIADYASSLIYAHLEYLQYFYNFPEIRKRILASLEQLAMDLYEVGMPSTIVNGESMCVYGIPVHKLHLQSNNWCYYVSNYTFPYYLTSVFHDFNQVKEVENNR